LLLRVLCAAAHAQSCRKNGESDRAVSAGRRTDAVPASRPTGSRSGSPAVVRRTARREGAIAAELVARADPDGYTCSPPRAAARGRAVRAEINYDR